MNIKDLNVITCTGYYNTGSSAVGDLLREFSNVQDYGDYEIRIAHEPDGLSDLEYNITADGVAVGTISIPKDEHLIDVSYDSLLKILTFKVITKDGEKTIQINISDLVDTYTSGDGLSLSNNQFSVHIDPNSERYITVSSQGIKFIGLDEIVTLTNKINTNLEVEIARAKAAEAALEEKYNTVPEAYQEALDKKADITMFDWNEE